MEKTVNSGWPVCKMKQQIFTSLYERLLLSGGRQIKKRYVSVKTSSAYRESYIRVLINGVIPRAAPSDELVESLHLLRNIANNMNQIAVVAHSTGNIHESEYKDNFILLKETINEMMILIWQPLKADCPKKINKASKLHNTFCFS